MNIEFEGFYQLQVLRPDGTVKFETPVFKNMIVDGGLDQMPRDVARYAMVGSGSTAPAFSNTSLESPLGAKSTGAEAISSYQNVSPYVTTVTAKYTFDATITGTIREVGLFGGNGSVGKLFSRALIVNSSGAPTPITLVGDETLNVYYILKFYPTLTDTVSTITIDGSTYTCRIRARELSAGWSVSPMFDNFGEAYGSCNAFSGDIGSITGAPSGSADYNMPFRLGSYINGSKEINFDIFFDYTKANFTLGLKSIAFDINYAALGYWQCSFTPPLPKTADNILSLVMKMSWSRKT